MLGLEPTYSSYTEMEKTDASELLLEQHCISLKEMIPLTSASLGLTQILEVG